MFTSRPFLAFDALVAIALVAMGAGCARHLPTESETPAAVQAPYPRLVPLEDIAALPAPEDPSADLQSRAAALKARATAMQTAE